MILLGYLLPEHLQWLLFIGKRAVGKYADFCKLLQIPGTYKEMGADIDFPE